MLYVTLFMLLGGNEQECDIHIWMAGESNGEMIGENETTL